MDIKNLLKVSRNDLLSISWAIVFISVKFTHWLFTESSWISSLLPIMIVALSGPYAFNKLTPKFERTVGITSKQSGGKIAVQMLLLAQSLVLTLFALYLLIIFFIALPGASSLVGSIGVGLVFFLSCAKGMFISNILLIPIVWLMGCHAHVVLRRTT